MHISISAKSATNSGTVIRVGKSMNHRASALVPESDAKYLVTNLAG